MKRFTAEEKKFSEAIKLVIELYYHLKSSRQEDWFSDKIVELISKILGLAIPNFYPCLYFQEYNMFRYRDKNEKIILLKSHFSIFIEIMEAIKQDIGNRMHEIFEIKGLVQEIRQSFELKDHQKSLRDGKAYARDIAEKFQCRVIPPVSKDATAKTLDEYQNLLSSVLNEPCQLFESFQVSVKRESDLYENFFEEEDGRISAPGYTRSDVSFLYAVKFILVKYQYVMDSYERLKLCKQCEKLFFEKKIGSKDYCSPSCRKKYNDALQIPEIRKCREKQNAWIRYKYKSIAICPKVYFLYKDECNGCTGAVKGGDCQVLRAKNKKAFKVINQQK